MANLALIEKGKKGVKMTVKTSKDRSGDGLILYNAFEEYFFRKRGIRKWKWKAYDILNVRWAQYYKLESQFTILKTNLISKGYEDLWLILEKQFIERGSYKQKAKPLPTNQELTALQIELNKLRKENEKLKLEIDAGMVLEMKLLRKDLSDFKKSISDQLINIQKR